MTDVEDRAVGERRMRVEACERAVPLCSTDVASSKGASRHVREATRSRKELLRCEVQRFQITVVEPVGLCESRDVVDPDARLRLAELTVHHIWGGSFVPAHTAVEETDEGVTPRCEGRFHEVASDDSVVGSCVHS